MLSSPPDRLGGGSKKHATFSASLDNNNARTRRPWRGGSSVRARLSVGLAEACAVHARRRRIPPQLRRFRGALLEERRKSQAGISTMTRCDGAVFPLTLLPTADNGTTCPLPFCSDGLRKMQGERGARPPSSAVDGAARTRVGARSAIRKPRRMHDHSRAASEELSQLRAVRTKRYA
ncbi:hypothetical protein MRX96_013092 [Rhipicephalus microplus]